MWARRYYLTPMLTASFKVLCIYIFHQFLGMFMSVVGLQLYIIVKLSYQGENEEHDSIILSMALTQCDLDSMRSAAFVQHLFAVKRQLSPSSQMPNGTWEIIDFLCYKLSGENLIFFAIKIALSLHIFIKSDHFSLDEYRKIEKWMKIIWRAVMTT